MIPENQTLILSDIDSVFLGRQPVPIQMAFYIPGTLSHSLLEQSLNSILPHFWPLAGTIHTSSNGKPEVQSRKQLSKVRIGSRNEPLFHWSPQMDLNSLSQISITPLSQSETPLFSAQLTNIQGGQVLGVSMSHALADGYSFFFFLDQWAKQSRLTPAIIPNHERARHTGTKTETRILEDTPLEEFTESTGFFFETQTSSSSQSRDPFLDPTYTFDWQTVAISEEELTTHSKTLSPEDGIRRSLNDVLCELLYRKFGPQQGSLTIPVDVRRFSPRLKETQGTYWGNGIRPVTFRVSHDDSLGSIAHQVGTQVRKLRWEKVEATLNFLASLTTRNKRPAFEQFKVMDPERGLLVTNLSRLPLETLVFGDLAPSDLRILTPMVGAAVILPKAVGAFIQFSKPLLT